jgi:tetratricopeptide (TPR) repeat protein
MRHQKVFVSLGLFCLGDTLMSKVNRNDPCPCSSGRKYKRCCLAKDRPPQPTPSPKISKGIESPFSSLLWQDEDDTLTQDSNQVLDLIKQDRLDDAEALANKLLQDYPEVPDGLERLAMVYEARGDVGRAIEMYQRSLEFTLNNDGYDEEISDYYRNKIHQLKSLFKE